MYANPSFTNLLITQVACAAW